MVVLPIWGKAGRRLCAFGRLGKDTTKPHEQTGVAGVACAIIPKSACLSTRIARS
ncbi:hypothetical protein PISMIDRAFT_685563 [Pisolithus microcarpus 441]|uniref:Uncharacterized protein n=1 Tax=Pisolithus microcarpus 441 TaxID=765257 RepID=A0A0C9ZB90_9AGAM|nr:hypothetical protein PISMIDRAFT_685563 [Pisolithus microcarpus 441]